MKSTAYVIFFALVLYAVVNLSSCRRQIDIVVDPKKGFSSDIQKIVPKPIIDTLRRRGMTINEGLIPPTLDGIYIADPYTLLSRTGPTDNYRVGEVISKYYYKFYGQTQSGSITYDFTNTSDIGKGNGAFIAGNGNAFTIFSEDKGRASGIDYKTLAVMSGEITSTGIKNFQYAFVMKEKQGEAPEKVGKLIAVGQARIWYDGNYLAEKSNFYPQSIGDQPMIQSSQLGSVKVSERQQ
ncbi:hypothetical protein BN8_04184 [Fibrisoma limi BUZ 3]|uniref:Uncharacterized protein n=1 Tax=Fibrisoma limi BUZ 3 TaxID=1185876 RepID=I2GM34_9BACT|nr:hypothetical protein [Fibrisoma limi]CCH54960.1 hypothetical protein BN8_04184 [Fibrisoma limi BUZ 3]